MNDQPDNLLESEGQKILSGLSDVELDPSSVSALYSRNPRVLSKAQRAVVIETIRRARAAYQTKRANKPTPPIPKEPKLTKEQISELKLDDLVLEIDL
jgi:hypothetical protein